MTIKQFCPFDGKPLPTKNLAYELVFAEGWNWEKVKSKTVVGLERKLYICEDDRRTFDNRQTYNGKGRIMLLENKFRGRRNGLAHLCEHIDTANQSIRHSEFEAATAEGISRLSHTVKDGMYIFTDDMGGDVMYAIPCCPNCHGRLPAGWLGGMDDFMAISLIGASNEAKCEFAKALACGESRKNLDTVSRGTIHISADKYGIESIDISSGTVMPLFLSVCIRNGDSYKKLIMGIYDSEACHINKDVDMFLFDADRMPKPGRILSIDRWRTGYVQCNVMPLSVQGDFQHNNKGKIVSASDLLEFISEKMVKENAGDSSTMALYNNIVRINNDAHCLKNMQFVGVILNVDLLKSSDEDWDYAALFNESSDEDIADVDIILTKTQSIESMAQEYRLFGDSDPNDFGRGEYKSKTWHCINSDPESIADLVEPISICALRKVVENEWI